MLCCHFTHTYTRCAHACMREGRGPGRAGRQAGRARVIAHLSKVNFTLCQAALFPYLLPSFPATCPPWVFLQHFARAQAAGTLRHASLTQGSGPSCPSTRAHSAVSPNATLTFTIFPYIYFAPLWATLCSLLLLAAPSCCSFLLLLLLPLLLPLLLLVSRCFSWLFYLI